MKNLLLIFLAIFSFSCSHLFYRPERRVYDKPEWKKLFYEDVYFKVKDGVKLHGQVFKSKRAGKPKGLVVLFHDYTKNISYHHREVSWLTNFHYDVFVWDYRGYGRSGGEADKELFLSDTLAALNYAHFYRREHLLERFILFGQGAGGSYLMNAHRSYNFKMKTDLIIVEGSFLSFKKIAKEKLKKSYWTYPFSFLAGVMISDEHAGINGVRSIKAPGLVIHCKEDKVIPFRYGREVFHSWGNSNKTFWEIENCKNLDTFSAHENEYREKLIAIFEDRRWP